MDKALTFWTLGGLKIIFAYERFAERVKTLSYITTPIMVVFLAIPWLIIDMLLLALTTIYCRVVYGNTISEQCSEMTEALQGILDDLRNDK